MFENYVKEKKDEDYLKLNEDENEILSNNNSNNKFKKNGNSNNKNNNNKIDYSITQNMKDLIYKVFAKCVENSKMAQKSQKQKMKKILSLLIFIQMRKIEMKLNFFNEFEKIIQYQIQQLKSKESQTLQDRMKLIFKKAEIMNISNSFKEIENNFKDNNSLEINGNFESLKNMDLKSLIEESNKVSIDNGDCLLDLNL